MRNSLYYGDNLQVLRDYIDSESVDLVYLDPPFNSNASYNVLFKEKSSDEWSPSQIKAFTDTWEWTGETERTYELDIYQNPAAPESVKKMIEALLGFLGRNAMTAYLVMMAPRLAELYRVLKPTGSLYLHCDPTASHYLKLLMDAAFGPRNFRNEVIWKRSHGHNSANRFGASHDVILVYVKGPRPTWNRVYQPYDPAYTNRHYRHVDARGRRYKHENPTGAGIRRGATGQQWRGIDPTAKGRHWVVPPEQLERMDGEGRIYWPKKSGAWPYLKVYLDEMQGVPLQDVWVDIDPINMMAAERQHYPTQKPEALLERIIEASSNPGDVILDPFCGCGSAVAVAEKLGRQWAGVDITHLAVAVMKNRLKTMFDLEPPRDYDVVGEPQDVESARTLALDDRFQFQYWAVSLLEAQPRQDQTRGRDLGVDGRLYFIDGPRRTPHSAIIQVKSGHVSSRDLRDLKGVVEREKAALGLFITLENPTRDMRTEAASGGFFHSDLWDRNYSKIQIRTVAELLDRQGFDLPPRQPIYRPAQRVRPASGQQGTLDELVSA